MRDWKMRCLLDVDRLLKTWINIWRESNPMLEDYFDEEIFSQEAKPIVKDCNVYFLTILIEAGTVLLPASF